MLRDGAQAEAYRRSRQVPSLSVAEMEAVLQGGFPSDHRPPSGIPGWDGLADGGSSKQRRRMGVPNREESAILLDHVGFMQAGWMGGERIPISGGGSGCGCYDSNDAKDSDGNSIKNGGSCGDGGVISGLGDSFESGWLGCTQKYDCTGGGRCSVAETKSQWSGSEVVGYCGSGANLDDVN